jgi:transketolase
MSLEDLAMMRAVFGSTVLYPCCANQTANARPGHGRYGIEYLRTTTEKTLVLYDDSEAFAVGGSKVLRRSSQDRVTILADGITVHEALKAFEELKSRWDPSACRRRVVRQADGQGYRPGLGAGNARKRDRC